MRNTLPLFILFFILLLTACTSSAPVELSTPSASINEMVVLTMEAYAGMLAKTPLTDEIEAPGEEFSIEVTQEPFEPTVVSESPEEPEDIEAVPTDMGDIPDSYYIWNIWGHRQYFPIGCEASAADDWTWYFGVDINEFNFQMELPASDNPDLGFVGSVDGPWGQVPPYAYGVHAAPVAQILQENYDMNAKSAKGFTIGEIKKEIALDQPVIAWVIGNCVGGIPYEYTDQEGNTVTVAAYEHVVIVTGYNEESLRYMNNGKFYDIQYDYFENSWSVLGNMVIYLAD